MIGSRLPGSLTQKRDGREVGRDRFEGQVGPGRDRASEEMDQSNSSTGPMLRGRLQEVRDYDEHFTDELFWASAVAFRPGIQSGGRGAAARTSRITEPPSGQELLSAVGHG